MDEAKLTVTQIINAIKMLTASEYNDFISQLASLHRPEDSIDAYIEEQRFNNGRVWLRTHRRPYTASMAVA
jgi:hypothetical protein